MTNRVHQVSGAVIANTRAAGLTSLDPEAPMIIATWET